MRLDADAATFQRYAYSLYSNGSPQCTTSLPHRYLGSRMCTEGVTALLRDLNHQQRPLLQTQDPILGASELLQLPPPFLGRLHYLEHLGPLTIHGFHHHHPP